MKPSSQVVMSAASVAAALQVIGGMHAEHKTLAVPSVSEFRDEARAAASSAQSQAMIRSAMVPIAASVKIDEQMMHERYAKMDGDAAARAREFLLNLQAGNDGSYDVAQAFRNDSVTRALELRCYSNCHSACHGSRGWR